MSHSHLKKHDHDDICEHSHDHDHYHGCCDCHCHHKEEENSALKKIFLIISVVLFIASLVLDLLSFFKPAVILLSVGAIVLCGYDIFIDGLKAALHLKIDETTLMSIAVIAALILGEYVEAAAVTVLFSIGEMLEDYAVDKSRDNIHALLDIQTDHANLVLDEGIKQIDAKDIEVGSVLIVNPFEKIPVDSTVTKGSSYIDSSAITGESAPLFVQEGSKVLSGMINGESAIYIKADNTYENSTASKIIELVSESEKNKGESEKVITKFARIYTPAVIIISILIALIPSLITGDYHTWIMRALTCLVASCPCSIVISIPLAYFSSIGALAKNGVLVKGGKYLEALSKSGCYAFDKTGTLTDSTLEIEKIELLSDADEDTVLKIAASLESHSSHPIGKSIVSYAKNRNLQLSECENIREIPGKGISGDVNGISVCVISDDDRTAILINGKKAASLIISDKIRNESASVVEDLKKLGIKKLVMLTGDNEKNAEKISKKLKIDHYSSLLPKEKAEIVKRLKEEHNGCVFTGDGINDAPVLKISSCGIAMGLGSRAAIESSDMVLSSGTLSQLPFALKKSRKTMGVIKQNLSFSLLFKVLVLVLAFFGIAPMWLAVLADTGVCLICVFNSIKLQKHSVGNTSLPDNRP